MEQRGKVFLVGAGPGDPKLLTLRGKEALQQADAVVYDRLVNPLILRWAPTEAERIYVGKLPDRHTLKQEEINQLLVALSKKGKVVVRLKGGDPAVFGRVGEEAEALAAQGQSFEIIPGITSAIAVPLYAGIPITHREFNSSFAVVTGHEDPSKRESSIRWESLATATETIVFLMGVSNLPYIVEQLTRYGRSPDTPVALIRWGTRVEQETLTGTLADIEEKVRRSGFASPAIILVGEVVRLRHKLAWFEKKPLFGQRILVTRARSQASVVVEQIDALGGEALEFPVIELQLPRQKEPIDDALKNMESYDWVIFTSVNGVEYFFRHLRERSLDVRRLGKARLAAIGPKTAEALEERGLTVQLLPEEFRAEGLLEVIGDAVSAGMKVLLPRADIARDVLPRELETKGAQVTEIDVYNTCISQDGAAEVLEYLKEGRLQWITFTSSSTVRNFVEALRGQDLASLLAQVRIASIGPITSATCRELGLHVDVEATTYTIPGLLQALVQEVARLKGEWVHGE